MHVRVIDHRGRLFGKVNLIDAAVGVFALVLIPLGYGAYVLFRVPVPTIVSVEPAQVVELQPATLRLQGTDFRPYLRARLGSVQSEGFLVESTRTAEVKLPDTMTAGTYDLILLDEARELVRMVGALTVVEPPPPPPPSPPEVALQVVGSFLGLSEEDVGRIEVGSRMGQFVEVLAVRAPEPGTQRVLVLGRTTTEFVDTPVGETIQLPAILRIGCEELLREQCHIGEVPVVRDAVIPLPTEDGTFSFVVTEVRPADALPAFQPPPPEVALQVVGSFLGLSEEDVGRIEVGSRMGQFVEVLAVRAPEPGTQRVLGRTTTEFVDTPVGETIQLPAILRIGCLLREQCHIGEVPVVRDAVIPLPTEDGTFSFVVTEVRPADALPAFQLVVVQAGGVFVGLSNEAASSIRVGTKFGAVAEVVAVGEPEPATDQVTTTGGVVVATPVSRNVQLPALLRLTCLRENAQCTVGAVALVQDAIVGLPVSGRLATSGALPSQNRQLSFQVRSVLPADASVQSPPVTMGVATVRVRFIVRPEVVDLVSVGAVDAGTPRDARKATLLTVDSDHRQVMVIGNFEAIQGQRFQLEQPMVAFTATVRVPLVPAQSGWTYKGRPIKVGGSFVFETTDTLMEGSILAMRLEPDANIVAR